MPSIELDNRSSSDVRRSPNKAYSFDDNERLHGITESTVPLTNGLDGDVEPTPRQKKPTISFLNGIALVIGLQIGSGIFSAPTQVSQHVETPGEGVLVWAVAGALVWTGAASFIELGLAIPENGGMQEYLFHCYGDMLAFAFSWTWLVISKPASTAIITLVFANHVLSIFVPEAEIPTVLLKLTSLLGLILVTTVNCLGAKSGATVANGFLVLKIFAVLSITALGVFLLLGGAAAGVPSTDTGWFGIPPGTVVPAIWTRIGNFVTALFGALFCYGGWETVGFFAGEIENASRTLPRIIVGAMIIAMSGYFLMNTSLYIGVPMEEMRSNMTPAVVLVRKALGPIGGSVYSFIIAMSALGSLNASVFSVGRHYVAASIRGYVPAILSNGHVDAAEKEVHYHTQLLGPLPAMIKRPFLSFASGTADLRFQKEVPVYALILNALIGTIYITLGTFNGLITFIGIADTSFLFLSAAGVFILRRQQGSHYRTMSINPIVFCVLSACLVLRGVISDPWQGVALIVLILAGSTIFWRISR